MNVMKTKILCSLLASSLLLGSAAAAVDRKNQGLACENVPQLIEGYFQVHYSIHSMSEALKTRTIEQFLDVIDPLKTLLVESEATRLITQLKAAFRSMGSGDCAPLESAYKLTLSRVQDDEKIVREILEDKNFKVDKTVELILDVETRGWAKTQEARRDLLTRLVHFQVASLMQADIEEAEAKKQIIHRHELASKHYGDRLTNGEVPGLFAAAFATALDPHTAYLSRMELENLEIDLRLSVEGIGAVLSSQDGFVTIEELVPGGSADKLNLLKPKDKIIAVAQDGAKPVSAIDMELSKVVRMIRGKKDTAITLTIMRRGKKTETFDVRCVRAKIDLENQAATVKYEDRTWDGKSHKIAVIDLPAFYGSDKTTGRTSTRDVRRLLKESREKGVEGVVLDVSRNGGGLLEEAVGVSGLFIRTGNIVGTRNASGQQQVLEDDDEEIAWTGPLMLLTSPLSASAAEILVGALKAYKRGLVVGTKHTYGKGTVQTIIRLPGPMGAAKVTTAMYFLPNGPSVQHSGVAAHIEVPSVFDSEEVGERKAKNSLPAQTITAFLSADEVNGKDPQTRWEPIDEAIIAPLGQKSHERVEKDAAIKKVKKELTPESRKKPLKLSELLDSSDDPEKKEGEEVETKSVREKVKDLAAPFVNEGVNIMQDWLSSLGTSTAKSEKPVTLTNPQ